MTENIDPVEAMARAIFAEQHSSLFFDLCREATQSNYRSMARSALAAAEAAGMVMVRREVLEQFAYCGGWSAESAGDDYEFLMRVKVGQLRALRAALAASLAQQEKP